MGRIITVSGELGSGKSMVSKALAARLGYQYVSTGQFHRDMAREMGIDALELNILAESDPSIDRKIDAMSQELVNDGNDYVVDSRIAWHFITSSFKVYLVVDPDIAAARVLADKQRCEEPAYADLVSAKTQLLKRKESENKRYSQKYGIDRNNVSNYDLVLDTSLQTVEQIVDFLCVQVPR